MPILPEGPLRAAAAHDQTHREAGDHARAAGLAGRSTTSSLNAPLQRRLEGRWICCRGKGLHRAIDPTLPLRKPGALIDD
jgi:hypothetical protein